MANEHSLFSKTIVTIFLAEDRKSIKFLLDGGEEIIARCDADCCSHTWIEDIFNPEAAIGCPVLKTEDIELPEEWREETKTNNDEEEMQYYGFALETVNGRCVIAYRNSSNGYYGGSLCWEKEYFYGGVHKQNFSNEVWERLI